MENSIDNLVESHLDSVRLGLSTKPEVDKLKEYFGTPQENTPILYEEIETVIGLRKNSNIKSECNRFNTIVYAWRKKLLRHLNIMMAPTDDRKGLVRLCPNERVNYSVNGVTIGVRKVRRCAKLNNTTDESRITGEERVKHEHLSKVAAQIELASKTAAKALNYKAALENVSKRN